MRITQFSVNGFKSIGSATLSDLQRVNILVGKNNSGKSALLECLRLAGKWSAMPITDGTRTKVTPLIPRTIHLECELSMDEHRSILQSCLTSPEARRRIDSAVDGQVFRTLRASWTEAEAVWSGSTAHAGFIPLDRAHNSGRTRLANMNHLFSIRADLPLRDYITAQRADQNFEEHGDSYSHLVFQLILPRTYVIESARKSQRLWQMNQLGSPSTLEPSGRNLVRVLHFLQSNNRAGLQAITEFVNTVLPSVGHPWVREAGTNLEIMIEEGFGGSEIPLHEMGAGTEQVLLIATAVCTGATAFMHIEEPENYLHVAAQRHLLRLLRSHSDRIQFFLTTQSPALLDVVQEAAIYRLWQDSSKLTHVERLDAGGLKNTALEFGFPASVFMQSDVVLYVEGPNDIQPFRAWMAKYAELKDIEVGILVLGGNNINHEDFDVEALGRSHPRTVIVFDSERAGSSERTRRENFELKCRQAGVACHRLGRAATENYYPLRVLRQVLGDQIEAGFIPNDDTPLANQLPTANVKKRGGELAKAMTREEIEATDLSGVMGTLVRFAAAIRQANV